MSKTSHWNQHARQWQWMGSPLRPDPQDVRIVERALADWHAVTGVSQPRALLMGVTPELATLRWPAGTRLTAVDHSLAMIAAVWPRAPAGAACAEWSALPLPDASHDIVVGDGCFVVLAHPEGYDALTAEVRRVLRADGLFTIRIYVRPEEREPLSAIFDSLHNGRIGSFHVFKWRLAMALHGGLGEGVRLADVWDAWHAAVPDPEALAARLGWPRESVLTIDAYRDVATRYTFPTLAEARANLERSFIESGCHFPVYELGERCPTLILRPR